MRARFAAVACSLVCAIAVGPLPPSELNAAPPEGGGKRSVADAKKALETARSNLAKAVERIQKDPPSTADLDDALAAVTALKAAIDAGAEHEPKDLEYAKSALAARKELRTQREYVEQRRAKVHIFNSRREIDAAAAKLSETVQRLESKQASAKDFEEARAASLQLEKQLARGQPFVSQDEKYASYLGDMKATLAKHRKAIDDRATLLAVEKQRAQVEDGRRALATAMTALGGKQVSDAQFESADKAAGGLAKLLGEGKELEGKDKAYRTYADQAQDELRQARKRIDTLWGQTGLARLKAEIEPARADLVQAARAISAKRPTEDQLAEARTAAIVVRKLIEKFQPQAARSHEFGQYVGEVKKTLVEVEVNLQRRMVEPARDAVAAALKALSDSKAGEEAFKKVEGTLKEAQQVLRDGERLEKDDRAYATLASEVRKRLQEGEARISGRRVEIAVARQRSELESARTDLTRALANLERRAPSDEQFDEAKTAAIVLEKTLETAKANDATLAKLVADGRWLLKTARTTIEKRRLEVDLERQKARIEEGRNEIARLMNKIWGNIPDQRLKDVEDAMERVRKMLADGAHLTSKDRAYDAYDREVKKRLDETKAKIGIRRDELAIDAQKAKVDPELKSLARAVEAIDGFGPKAAAITAAEQALQQAEAALAAGAELEKRLRPYASFAKDARKTIETAKVRIAKRKLELAASDGRSLLEERVGGAKSSLETAKLASATDGDIAAAAAGIKGVKDALERSVALENENKGYGAYATKVRGDLERLDSELELAKQAVAFRKATLEPLSAGNAAADGGDQASDLRSQKEKYEKAVAAFKSCQRSGEEQLGDNKALASIAVLIQGQKSTPKEVIALCVERAEAVEQVLKKVVGLVAFDEGPKRSFEKGKALLGQASSAEKSKADALKAEALAQFEECISSGKILEYKNPELKDRKFPVAGQQVTLSELVVNCTAESKRLRGK